MAARPNPRATLARNVKTLMTLRGWTQSTLAEKAKVGQKTISNVINSRKNVQLEIIDSIARAFGLNLWHLIMPDLTDDLLNGKGIEKLFNGYLSASVEGRDFIDAAVKRETERVADDG